MQEKSSDILTEIHMQQMVVAILGRRRLRSSMWQHLIVKGRAAARQSLLRAPVLHVGASSLRAHTITTAFKQARTGALLLSFRFSRDSQISLASGGETHSLPFSRSRRSADIATLLARRRRQQGC